MLGKRSRSSSQPSRTATQNRPSGRMRTFVIAFPHLLSMWPQHRQTTPEQQDPWILRCWFSRPNFGEGESARERESERPLRLRPRHPVTPTLLPPSQLAPSNPFHRRTLALSFAISSSTVDHWTAIPGIPRGHHGGAQ
jgi:hypothetical protein